MILGGLTLLIMAVVAYAYWREGALTAFVMACNVLVAGVVAFNFWEPLADLLEPSFQDTFLQGTEDALVLVVLFCLTLIILRVITNNLAATLVEYPSAIFRGGAVVFGLLTGYLVAGFLICVMQTLPLPHEFLGFQPYTSRESSPLRRYFPPDLVWLSAMHRLSGGVLGTGAEDHGRKRQFDPNGNFEWRYHRYRRLDDNGKALAPRYDLAP